MYHGQPLSTTTTTTASSVPLPMFSSAMNLAHSPGVSPSSSCGCSPATTAAAAAGLDFAAVVQYHNRKIGGSGGIVSMCDAEQFQYCLRTRSAFNIAQHVQKKLELLSIVFTTAMVYFHEVAHSLESRDLAAVHEVTLICACLLLAAKAEQVRLRLSKLIQVAFAVDPVQQETDFLDYRRMVLDVEVLVCDRLKFQFQRSLPFTRLAECMEKLSAANASSATATATSAVGVDEKPSADTTTTTTPPATMTTTEIPVADINLHCSKHLQYLLLSPTMATLSSKPTQVADALIHIVAGSLGFLDSVNAVLNLDVSELNNVEIALVQVLFFAKRRSNLSRLQRLLDEEYSNKKRSRSPSLQNA